LRMVPIGTGGQINVRRTKTQRATVVQGALNMKTFARFMNDESGATAIEYGLIAACISVAIIAVIQGVGTKLNSTFTNVSNALH
jgi:pilus assembly protein Flp/PilA